MNPLLLQALWPLHYACANADLDQVKAVLRDIPDEDVFRRINERIKAGGHTPLHVLFHSMVQNNGLSGPRSADYFSVLSYMVSRGARLDIEDNEQLRPAGFLEGRTTPALQRFLEAQQALLSAELNDARKQKEAYDFREQGRSWNFITQTLKCSEDSARNLDRRWREILNDAPSNLGHAQHRINPRVHKVRVQLVDRTKRVNVLAKVANQSIHI